MIETSLSSLQNNKKSLFDDLVRDLTNKLNPDFVFETKRNEYARYKSDPVKYSENVLGIKWWDEQKNIAEALLKHKRVFVKASHAVGKSFLAAGLVNWFYDCFNPGICITTAPTQAQIQDVLWKEIRTQRHDRPGLQPKAPRMESSPEHFAVGYTATTGDAFQGRHSDHVLIIFDEGVGVPAEFWEAAEGMMTGANCYWVVICNPTDTSSKAYEEAENTDKWHVISISALDHPNIVNELQNKPIEYPGAVSLGWVQDRIREWCSPIITSDKRSADFEFPKGSDNWYRPGALAESRMLGRWPTQGSYAVWSESMWKACLIEQELDETEEIEIGCDVARFGDDFTSIMVRQGNCALWHETHNGWDTSQTTGRLKELAKKYGINNYRQLVIKIDDDGIGGGAVDQKGDFNFQGVSGANQALQKKDYPNKRSEVWFNVCERADEGRLDLTRLPSNSLKLLKTQVMAPTWKLDSSGRRVVEPKSDTKKRLKRSPDDADCLNITFSPQSKRKIQMFVI